MPARIDALTSLRFPAALAIVVYHATDYVSQSWRDAPLGKARLAVDFFFILSGFILTHVYGQAFAEGRANIRNFIVARLARIYPAHLFVMILFLLYITISKLIGLQFNTERYHASSFLVHLFLLDAFSFDVMSWNYPAWSISAEFFAYLSMPLLAPVVMRLPRGAALVASAALIVLFAWSDEGLRLTQRTTDLSMLRILPEFALGMLMYRVGPPRNSTATVVAVLASAAAMWWRLPNGVIAMMFAPLIALASSATGACGRVLAWRPLVYLGEISYSLYIAHSFVLSIVFSAFKLPAVTRLLPASAAFWIALALAVPAACVLFHVVETPGRDLVRRLWEHLRTARNLRLKTLVGALCAALLAAVRPAAAVEPLDIYILAGQSNMSGRASLAGLPPFRNAGHVLALKHGTWEPAREPVADDKDAQLGPSLAFADALYDLRPHAIGLVNCAIGATAIRQWRPDDHPASLYGSCLARARAAASKGRVVGFLWYQGEWDAFSDAAATAWPKAFGRIVQRFRHDLAAPRLPVVFTQIGPPSGGPKRRLMRLQAELTLADAMMVSAADLRFQDDNLHLDAASQLALGRRYAAAMEGLRTVTEHSR